MKGSPAPLESEGAKGRWAGRGSTLSRTRVREWFKWWRSRTQVRLILKGPGAVDDAPKCGGLSLRLGPGRAKSHSLFADQTLAMKYNRNLKQVIPWD
jgi:hypothetical protein